MGKSKDDNKDEKEKVIITTTNEPGTETIEIKETPKVKKPKNIPNEEIKEVTNRLKKFSDDLFETNITIYTQYTNDDNYYNTFHERNKLLNDMIKYLNDITQACQPTI